VGGYAMAVPAPYKRIWYKSSVPLAA
jgi:hypothetical protein